MKVESRIKVQLTVELTLHNVWGDDCTVGQMRAQAATEAEAVMRSCIDGTGAKVKKIEAINLVSDLTHKE